MIEDAVKHSRIFVHTGALIEIATAARAQSEAAHFLEQLATEIAGRVC